MWNTPSFMVSSQNTNSNEYKFHNIYMTITSSWQLISERDIFSQNTLLDYVLWATVLHVCIVIEMESSADSLGDNWWLCPATANRVTVFATTISAWGRWSGICWYCSMINNDNNYAFIDVWIYTWLLNSFGVLCLCQTRGSFVELLNQETSSLLFVSWIWNKLNPDSVNLKEGHNSGNELHASFGLLYWWVVAMPSSQTRLGSLIVLATKACWDQDGDGACQRLSSMRMARASLTMNWQPVKLRSGNKLYCYICGSRCTPDLWDSIINWFRWWLSESCWCNE